VRATAALNLTTKAMALEYYVLSTPVVAASAWWASVLVVDPD